MLSDIGIVMKFVVVLVLSCVLVWGDAKKVRCIGREREALVSFKNGLIDDFGMLSTWKSEECCNWYGVWCSNTTGNVISLRLSTADAYNGLRGKVSSSLIELHHLTYLDLSNSDFGGHPVPEFMGSMKQLQHLYLRHSGFSGIVPLQLGNLTNLLTLDLSLNYLSSKNLNWLSSLSLLSYLDFSYFFDLNHTNLLQPILNLRSIKELHLQSCDISDDNLSAGIMVNSSSFSTSLSFLDLSNNYLTSSAFNWLSLSNVSSSLVRISLEGNKLSGRIPDVFERFTHLEFLDVSYNMLEGEIPKSLGNLTHLGVLILFSNGISGQLDELVGNLSSKSILGSLQILDLAYNGLTGSVPDLTQFSALTEVYLGSNKLTGPMPVSVGQLSTLHILEVSYNNLEGSVNESHFIKLHNLKILDLSNSSLKLNIGPDWSPPFQLIEIYLRGCNVGPSFPKWIQTQTNLLFLDLSRAGIIDEVPSWLWSAFPQLDALFLSHNEISGTIPDLSTLFLESIDVSHNKFSGSIPLLHEQFRVVKLNENLFLGSISSICEIRLSQLYSLVLSNNRLSGEIPDCWEKFPGLAYLELANNSFSDKIPRSLGYVHNLHVLQLHDNNLSGELPSTLRSCQYLMFIDVGGNELAGKIPDWIGDISQLRFLNLGRNRLYGSIPPSMCNLTLIQVLDIHMNNLSGTIPPCFTMLAQKNAAQSLQIFGFEDRFQYNAQLPNAFSEIYNEYTSIGWKGQESEYANNLFILGLVDFSSNRLTGNIPESFFSMRGLRSLNLSRNILTGNIIPDIGQMEILEVLDLSSNQLCGEIPASLAKLHFLSVLDLSNNNLSGKIPSSTQLQSFNASCYAGNNGLCGKPLTLCPQDIPRPPTTTIARGEKDDVFSRLSFMQECGISMGFGFILGFWGLIGSFILKKPWRYAFFKSMDAAGKWLCLRYEMNMKRMRSDKSRDTQKKQIECGRVNRGVRQS